MHKSINRRVSADTHFILVDNGADGEERSAFELRERVEAQLSQSKGAYDSKQSQCVLN